MRNDVVEDVGLRVSIINATTACSWRRIRQLFIAVRNRNDFVATMRDSSMLGFDVETGGRFDTRLLRGRRVCASFTLGN